MREDCEALDSVLLQSPALLSFHLRSNGRRRLAPTLRTNAINIGQSAIGMVRVYGETAEHEAIIRARKFERSNDHQGFDTWTAIARVIHEGSHSRCIAEKSPSDREDRPTP